MPSSAEAAAYLQWCYSNDELSLRFVSWKTKVLANVVRCVSSRRFQTIVRQRGSLSARLSEELSSHSADTIIDLGTGYSTRGYHWTKHHPKTRYIEVDTAAVVERKRALMPAGGPVLVPGDLRDPSTYHAVQREVTGTRIIVLLEGVLTYLNAEDTKEVVEGIELLMQKHKGVIITHQAASDTQWRSIRHALWGKRYEAAIAPMLSRRGWAVRTKKAGEWTLIIAKR